VAGTLPAPGSGGSPRMNRSSSSLAHIQVPVPPRRPTGARRPSRWAFRIADGVLKPQYREATVVVMYGGQCSRCIDRLSADPPGGITRPAPTRGSLARLTAEPEIGHKLVVPSSAQDARCLTVAQGDDVTIHPRTVRRPVAAATSPTRTAFAR
jgi:hypothetical protein